MKIEPLTAIEQPESDTMPPEETKGKRKGPRRTQYCEFLDTLTHQILIDKN